MIDSIAVGNKIKALRVHNNYNQDQIAEILYVSRQAVSRWELGQTLPSVDNLLELCKIFKVSFEEILCLDAEIVIDPNNIFFGHDRKFIIKKIINSEIKVDLPDVFYLLSPEERIQVLKAIKEKKIQVDINRLFVKLTPEEQKIFKMGAQGNEF